MDNALRVVAWDDPRCVQPLQAAAEIWQKRTGERIAITRRPLTAFNDQPLIELAPISDVMIVDYPHIAQALEVGAIVPIGDFLDAADLKTIADRAIGPAQESFVVDGVTAGLASDAACHVSAYRQAAFDAWSEPVPETWDDVFALQVRHPGAVALALYPTDAISYLLSFTAGVGAGPDGGERLFPDPDAALHSLELLARLAAVVDEDCWSLTPQALFAAAAERPEIAYIPLTFGYSQKSKPTEGSWSFGAPPAGCGSLLGGAGMAVSAGSASPDRAAQFACWYCGDEGQRLAGRNGGQPAGLAAWEDAETDALNGGFFSATRNTQANAYVRPRATWWPAVQAEAGEVFAKRLREGAVPDDIISALEAVYRRHRGASHKAMKDGAMGLAL